MSLREQWCGADQSIEGADAADNESGDCEFSAQSQRRTAQPQRLGGPGGGLQVCRGVPLLRRDVQV